MIRAAAMGALFTAPFGCGDDDSNDTATTDVHPTAGPCAHNPDDPSCDTTGAMTSTATSTATSTTDTTMSMTDAHPTTPCAHDPDAPGCNTSTGPGSESDGATGSTGGSTGSTGTTTGG
jgi:hypothetical protein